MHEKAPRQESGQVLRFGAGLNSTPTVDEIQVSECTAGENFNLSLDNSEFQPRRPFTLVGTAPNALEITGYAQLHKQDGTLSTLIQAKDKVYSWDGTTSGFTQVGTVAEGAKLRGSLDSNFTLDDKVIIVDASMSETVKQWDGETFEDMPTNLNAGFYARYCFVENERAWFADVLALRPTPHMIVGSKRGDPTVLSVNDRPSSALNDEDPFYLLSPDLRPVNGLVAAFGNVLFSSRQGSVYKVLGETARDFNIQPFYSGSAATGVEGMVNVGNDVFYSKRGAIETLSGLEQFGNVAVDDITRFISEEVGQYDGFRLVYNRDRQRVYCFPKDDDRIYVFHKPIYDDVVKRVSLRDKAQYRSPWMKWTTNNDATFIPSVAWAMLSPVTKKMEVYFGDASGNVYQMEGDEYTGDNAETDIKTFRTSGLFKAPQGQSHDLNGWILYRNPYEDVTVTITFCWQGFTGYDQSIQVVLPKITGYPEWCGDEYFCGDSYFCVPDKCKVRRQEWSAAGRDAAFNVTIEAETSKDFEILEVGFRFEG